MLADFDLPAQLARSPDDAWNLGRSRFGLASTGQERIWLGDRAWLDRAHVRPVPIRDDEPAKADASVSESVAMPTLKTSIAKRETKSAPVAVASEGKSAEKHHQAGRELLKENKYKEAIAEFDEAIKLQPDFPLAYNARGFAYFMLRDTKHALEDYDAAIRSNPKYLNAYQNRSRARKASGDAEGSKADDAKAMEKAHLVARDLAEAAAWIIQESAPKK